MSPDLVLLGNLLVDDVVFPDGRTRMAQPVPRHREINEFLAKSILKKLS